MVDQSLAFASALQLAELVRTRQVSPIELVDLFLDRIAALNPKLNAYLTVAADQARSAAGEAERVVMGGGPLPPLHGVPLSIKDLHATKGLRTTFGSYVYREHVPDGDAVAVERLRRAGGIILGKTNTPEFGQSATTENRLGDHGRNPWNPERTSGGSSGGAAAAVAAGLGPLALGSDGGGSIRVPAGFCGVVGFKPTYGRVPAHGGLGGMPMFSHLGPITRTVRDAALMLGVMAGFDRRDPNALRQPPPDFLGGLVDQPATALRNLRVAWSPDLGYARVEATVRSVAGTAAQLFAAFGCHLEEASPATGAPFPIFGPIVAVDEYAASGHLLQDHADELMRYVRATFEHGQGVMGYEYSQALRGLERFRAQMADFFEGYDLLLCPTNAVPAFPVGRRPKVIDGHAVDTLWGPFPFAAPFNLTGQPAITVPCGFAPDGLPIGLQIVGRFGDEVAVLRAAAAFEQARPWAEAKPALAAL